MKYAIERTFNLQKRGAGHDYENLRIGVSDADSAEEAEKELKEWANNYITTIKNGRNGNNH